MALILKLADSVDGFLSALFAPFHLHWQNQIVAFTKPASISGTLYAIQLLTEDE
jgi:hypothetical protein